MIAFPNCKINLGLYIENKRNDGFHNIKTVFYPVELKDVLEIIESDTSDFSLSMSGITVNGDLKSNLCFKAYSLLKNDFQLPAVKIHLHKAIPHGAGLGGGSSDAAFTIKMLNSKFNLHLHKEQMQYYAGKLGSDCAFFIENKAVVAEEKGDVFESIEIDLNAYHILIVKPNVFVSTPEAYQWVKARNETIDIKSIIKQPIRNWKDNLINDFEESVFKKYPIIASVKELLYENDAVYASMSGSGAAVFGIFKEAPISLPLPEDCFCWSNKTL
ncbi:MAG: 4-(cytidine 5'-diphospho)-2-C-methyl-D-erythritol kinase [Bacteroidetes bacterium]|nr:4-(cytidine 5'-diphospho)-2-C-methyl-D-erythritol kinase [Bacteroidota bacterium]